MLQRALFLGLIFALELTAISVWLDNDALRHRSEFLTILYQWGAWIIRGAVGFATLFVTFAYLKYKRALERLSSDVLEIPIRWSLLALHVVAMVIFVLLSFPLYLGTTAGIMVDLLAAGWLIAGLCAIALAAFAVGPPKLWLAVLRGTDHVWAYALIAVVLACVVGNASRSLWQSAGRITFILVQGVLHPFVSTLVADPRTMNIGTPKFSVEIAPECSGFEGAGLMLAFGIVWLSLFRRECRFPQALLLIPGCIVFVFFLNAVRTAGLILIGNAGAERVALGGFHSQAGWISFNVVALGFAVAARRTPWLTAQAPEKGTGFDKWTDSSTAAYEELAFRGFLIRRLIAPDFESLDVRKYTWIGLLVSSIAFGVLHGQHWLAGILAGLLYAAALIRQGRIGEAVAAHATTNALLAGYVFAFHKWDLW